MGEFRQMRVRCSNVWNFKEIGKAYVLLNECLVIVYVNVLLRGNVFYLPCNSVRYDVYV